MFNLDYYNRLVKPLPTADLVTTLLTDPAVVRKHGADACNEMKKRWIADHTTPAKTKEAK